ncbi:uncharacterized protein LOC101847455 [Aplysia californica]|uniref:Uncharacterized protein LOC101847455 n=1 Tax=Aplysia californica TaxID=6500 RepID=A0ABM0K4V5_APLCA|nr:uncharacterized protein LOC101847455 [Aplysia californica]
MSNMLLASNSTAVGLTSPHLSNNDQLLLTWRKVKVLDLVPILVLDSLYMFFGVIGNSVVCYICYFRMQRNVINNFVLSLAGIELFGCIFTIPVSITEVVNAYWFDFPKLCKTERYFRKFVIFSSACILVAIAAERYLRIVKPHRPHVTIRGFQKALCGALTLSFIIAIPEAILAGSETVRTPHGNGVVCSTYHSDQFRGTIYPQLWAFFVVLVYIVSTSTIAAIYFIIASKIWTRGKVPTDGRSRPNTPDSTLQRRVRPRRASSSFSCPKMPLKENEFIRACVSAKSKSRCNNNMEFYTAKTLPLRRHSEDDMLETKQKRGISFIEDIFHTTSNNPNFEQTIEREQFSLDLLSPHTLSPVGSLRRRSGYSRKRTTFIMFVMTLTTAVSYLPHIVVMLHRLNNPGVETTLSPDMSVFFYFAWNSFFISLSCHPFVYGFWNGRFKLALAGVWLGFKRGRGGKGDRESSSTNPRNS